MRILEALLRGLLGIMYGGFGLYAVVWGIFAGFRQFQNNNITYGYSITIGSVLISLILYYLLYWLIEPLSKNSKMIVILAVLLIWVLLATALLGYITVPFQILPNY